MFGTWAKALFVYLAVSFVLNEKGKTVSAKQEFSCIFKEDNYKMITNNPIWSTKNDTPADLYNISLTVSNPFEYPYRKFQITLLNSIEQAFVKTLRANPLNNVDQFLRFIQAYKNQTENKRSLESFFNDYNVRFQPLQDPVSFLIQISHQLVAGYPRADGQVYMVSAYVDPPERFVKYVKKSDDNLTESTSLEEELTKDQFQRHVAGVIKIKINNTRGIISIDLDEKLFIIKLIK
uniref:Uncharacterized protein n=1 Tax=Cacopsylla melanoneura TaxID=428564 RepID=A0A8D8V3F3_9HEMI